jgi:hypothetical protein
MKEILQKDKFLVWGVVGLLFALFLWYMTKKQIDTQTVSVPYLTPQPMQQETGDPSQTPTISEQGNIIGDHPNSVLPNGTIPSFTYHGVPPTGFTPTGNQGFWNLNPAGSWTWSDSNPIRYPSVQPNPIPTRVGGVDATNPATWSLT